MRAGKGKWQEILRGKPDSRLVAFLAVGILLVLLIPLLRLSFYTLPWYDDYSYGKFVKGFLDQERTWESALEGAVNGTKVQWYAWQGTFSSIFFMCLMPGVWGEEFYFLGPFFLILILPFSVWILGRVMLRDVLKADNSIAVIISSIAAAVCVVMIHSPGTGFFWYNGGIHYVGMHSFLLLLAAGWMKLLIGGGRIASAGLILWTVIGAVLAGGANYVTALQGAILAASLVGLGVVLRKKRTFLLLPSMAVYVFAFYKNIIAPGNSVRTNVLSDMGRGMGALASIGNSFLEAFLHLGEFTGPMTLAVLLLLAPLIRRVAVKCSFRFRYPELLLLWSLCLYASGFTPGLYTLGFDIPDRTVNAVKLTYQILLFVNEVYWVGWLCRKLEGMGEIAFLGWIWEKKRNSERMGEMPSLLFFLAMGLGMLCLFAMEPDRRELYSSCGAYRDIRSGEAYNFYLECRERIDRLKGDEHDIVFQPFQWTETYLYQGDLPEEPWEHQNTVMAEWYGKGSVRLERKSE